MNLRIQTYVNQAEDDANVFLSFVLSLASQCDNVQTIGEKKNTAIFV